MQHLFHIHSNINLIVAIGIVEQKVLNPKDVHFLLARGVDTDFEGINKHVLHDDLYYNPFHKKQLWKSFKRDNSVIVQLDQLINGCIDKDGFCYYAPHSRNAFYSIFASHHECKQVHYIEDGMDNYLSLEGLEKKYPTIVPIGHKVLDFAYRFVPFISSKRLRSYDDIYRSIGMQESVLFGIGKDTYQNQNHKSKNIQTIALNKIPYFERFSTDYRDIFVFDAVIEQKVVEQQYLDQLLHWFGKSHNSIDTLAIKFHPFQTPENREGILKLLGQYMNVATIADTVLMEVVFAREEDLQVYGMGSSLLTYACGLNPKTEVEVLYPHFHEQGGYTSSRLPIWEDCFRNDQRVKLLGRDLDY